jgi:hypothetical protein
MTEAQKSDTKASLMEILQQAHRIMAAPIDDSGHSIDECIALHTAIYIAV